MALEFPDIGHPRTTGATNAGDSYKVEVQDSTITTTTDAGYKHTRPRTTKMIHTWIFVFTALSAERARILLDFFHQVGTYQAFAWTNWIDGKTYTVRFAERLVMQERDPYGWNTTLKFEEV